MSNTHLSGGGGCYRLTLSLSNSDGLESITAFHSECVEQYIRL